MFTAQWIAPCGLDCSLCSRALLPDRPCPGCRGTGENKPAFCREKCGIIRCRARRENGYTFCDECPDFPCPDVMEKENRYTSQYPLYESPLQNLRDIREKGMEAFLQAERKAWSCPACGSPVSVHDGVCSGCGKRYGARVIPMGPDTWRIEDGGVRFFVLSGTEKALMIDSGMSLPHARALASRLTDRPLFLLNTHADMDHTGGNAQFESFYMHPDDAEAYRKSGKGGTILPIRDGEELDLGGRPLRIIHLPGHTPGSIAVLDIRSRVLISGDPIQTHGRIFMFGERRNLSDYVASLRRLEAMRDAFDEIWPSHADLPVSPDIIPALVQGAEKILRGEIPGTPEAFHGHDIRACDLGFTVLLCDP